MRAPESRGPGAARIVVINPNSTEAVTRGIDEALQPLRFAGGPRIDCVTLREGPPGIETQAHADAVVAPLCERVRCEDAASHAFVIACFGDPGLQQAREATARPVFGIAHSAYLHAMSLGRRFGVIAILPASVARHARYVRALGLAEHYAASVPIGVGVTALHGDEVGQRMEQAGRELTQRHRCDVVILGCAGMARYREALASALGVAVVDPCQAGASRALAAVCLREAG
jgi:Asp/Glu/hydantoin racemase